MKKFVLSWVLSFIGIPLLFAATDNRHLVTTEVGVGYSSVFHKSDLSKPVGLAGATLQVGYEWNLRQFLLHTGVEFASVNNLTKGNPFSLTIPYTIGLPDGMEMLQRYSFSDFREKQYLGQINIPLMAGGIFDDRYYFLAGVKLGVPVYMKSLTMSEVRTTLSDPTLIGELGDAEDVPVHDVATTSEAFRTSVTPNINVQLSAEVGVSISGFLPKKKGKTASPQRGKKQPLPYYYRVGLFCDYGLTSCVKGSEPVVEALAAVALPRDIRLHSTTSTAGRFSSFLVGAKFAMLFQVNRPKKPAKPQSWLDVDITDETTGKLLASKLNIRDTKTGKLTTREAKKGKVHARTKAGTFNVEATAKDYYSATQSYTIEELGENVQLSFALRHRPYFRLRVTNTETQDPLAVSALFVNRATNDTIRRLSTDVANGTAKCILEDNVSYRLCISQFGYEPYEADLMSIDDSLNIALLPIKQGRTIVLHHLYFATNQTRILPESESALNDLYEFLAENPAMRIRITGHTDNVGSDEANMKLSQGRAAAVKQALVTRGIADGRIETRGMGETQPIATNETEEGRTQNRRVEFEILAD
ncbi:MAG: OmpA family protein [Paludibacteraceae bacterium]